VDTIATIVVTAFVNIIITGIVSNLVFYRYQKRIDSAIAKSLFEHQTKFTQIHAKQVEALADLYQRFIVYKTDFNNMVAEATKLEYNVDESGKGQFKTWKKEEFDKRISTVLSAKIGGNRKKYEDFAMYFDNNRLYLSDRVCTEISSIFGRHDLLDFAMFVFFDDVPEAFIRSGKNAVAALNIQVDVKPDLERPDYLNLIHALDKEVDTQAEKLERLYKSVAQAE
jgi:hypothetical protein